MPNQLTVGIFRKNGNSFEGGAIKGRDTYRLLGNVAAGQVIKAETFDGKTVEYPVKHGVPVSLEIPESLWDSLQDGSGNAWHLTVEGEYDINVDLANDILQGNLWLVTDRLVSKTRPGARVPDEATFKKVLGHADTKQGAKLAELAAQRMADYKAKQAEKEAAKAVD